MEPLLISACLLGMNCKYNGGTNALPEETIAALRQCFELLSVCPEVEGGLPVPREPSERRGEGVFSCSGRDVTAAYQVGAAAALAMAQRHGCRMALLKERSPSCGCHGIYDGSFSGRLIPGLGVTAETLRHAGILVYGETEIDKLL